MKIRSDFVSNSSSSSFVIIGKVFNGSDFMNKVRNTPGIVKKFNKLYETDFKDVDEIVSEYGVYDLVDAFIRNKNLFFQFSQADWEDEPDSVAVGIDPSNGKMSNTDTLGDFKQKVLELLKSADLEANIHEIKFISGGSDASGSSWIYSRG